MTEPQEPSATPSTLERLRDRWLDRAFRACADVSGMPGAWKCGLCPRCGCTPWAHAWRQAADELAALRPSEGPETGRPPAEEVDKQREQLWQAIYDAAADEGSILHDDTVTAIANRVADLAALPAGPETGDRERLRELAFIGAVAVHREVWRYSHNAINIDGHTDRDFNACPHPDCVLVRQAAPAAQEGQK